MCVCVSVCVCVTRSAGLLQVRTEAGQGARSAGAVWHPLWRKPAAAGELWRSLPLHPSDGACALLRTLDIVGYSIAIFVCRDVHVLSSPIERDNPHIGDLMAKSGSHFKKLYIRIKGLL